MGFKEQMRERLGLDRKQDYSQEAKDLLANPLLLAFFEQAEVNIINQWKAAQTCDEREEMFRCQQALRELRNYLEGFLMTGKVK